MKKLLLLLITIHYSLLSVHPQNNFRAVVKDSATKEPLYGIAVTISNTTLKGTTNEKGMVVIRKVPDGKQEIVFTSHGHKTTALSFDFPLPNKKTIVVKLPESEIGSDETMVTTFRNNTRVEECPAPVHVIGQVELAEESTITPGSITHALSNLSMITVQRTNQLNGNDVIRMEGLDASHTQVMRDGMPLYGGFSGSMGALAVPPLDLKQVEIIKGSTSSLYGSGAVGGILNMISKTPSEFPEGTITINASALGEGNVNAFTSGKVNKLGYTVFAGVNVKQALDVNGEGFADVPKYQSYLVHPRLFFDATPKTQVIVGFSSAYDERTGGDIQAVDYGASEAYPFFHGDKTFRNTLDFSVVNKHSQKHTFTVKAAGSAFERDVNNSGRVFNGIQYSSYAELNDEIKLKKHTIVAGLNFISENFKLVQSDGKNFGNYDNYTAGGFLQDDWRVHKKLTIQLGLRYDYHFTFYSFVLPRIAFLYKPKPKLTLRLASGTGYKTPNMFDLAEPSAYIQSLGADVKSENSYGVNADINYHTVMFDALNVQLAQGFFYANIYNPLALITDTTKKQFATNGDYKINSYGTDTYLRFSFKDVALSIAYNHTESVQKYDTVSFNMPFQPKDKLISILTYTIEDKWKFGVEATFTGNQYLYNNDLVNDFWMFGTRIERKFSFGSLALNCRNILDNRQSKYETIVEGTRRNPMFKPVWSSLEGRVINLSLKLDL